MNNVQVVLEPYIFYSPCHFSMIDGQNDSLTESSACFGGDFAISDASTRRGKAGIWTIRLPSSLFRLRPEAVGSKQASEKLSFGYLGQCY